MTHLKEISQFLTRTFHFFLKKKVFTLSGSANIGRSTISVLCGEYNLAVYLLCVSLPMQQSLSENCEMQNFKLSYSQSVLHAKAKKQLLNCLFRNEQRTVYFEN